MSHRPLTRASRILLLTACAFEALTLTASTAQAQESIELDPITVRRSAWEWLSSLLTEDPADTGTTTLDSTALRNRGDGSDDANEAFTKLPTVQVAGDADNTAGENADTVLDLRPREMSISGARTDQNTVIVNGMPVNSLTGNEDPFGATPLDEEFGNVNFNSIYGLHSQTQFIPSSLVETATLTDSNASAETGGFQGGVLQYDLVKPSREASGKLSVSFQNDSMTRYELGTEDGTNPKDRAKPDWSKWSYSFQQTMPVGEASSLVIGHSTQHAESVKEVLPQYRRGTAESESDSRFWLLGFAHDFKSDNTFNLTGTWSDYYQDWESYYVDGQQIDQTNESRALTASWQGGLGDYALGRTQLSNLRFSLDVNIQDNATRNLANSNVYYSWYGAYRDGYETDAFNDWCDSSIDYTGATGVPCRTGGIGDRAYEDQRARLAGKLTGDIWHGTFKFGAAVEHVNARRKGEGYVYNSSTTRTTTGSYVCPADADDCIPTQFFSTRVVQPAYDVEVDATKAEAFFELDQKWGEFGLRAGLRADYNDYLRNLDIAPRLVATWTPTPSTTLTLGANRYYSADFLTYAIHDAVPRGITQRRTATDGVVGEWTTLIDNGSYYYSQGNLRTPYTDELSFGATWTDSVTDGTWRARIIDRHGKDQFAGTYEGRADGSRSLYRRLTNDGTSRYRSFTLEYEKKWQPRTQSRLDYVGLTFSGVVAARKVSAESYFGSSENGEAMEFIWYKDQSYTRDEFDAATGNFDIPVRAALDVTGSWNDGGLIAGLSTGVTFAYDGARCQASSSSNCAESDRDNPVYGTQPHLLFEPFHYDAVVTVDLNMQARIAEVRGNPVMLELKISNLFDERGNRTASTSNPWIAGRSGWLGTTMTW
ncbi:hypothetical protein BMG00_12845 [Thioclava marina]|uniref:TonB-dependent receptor plug domain-containing protein n=1 Tax=Thioclava marina TaxID=1915077 RepID=A0ABX3ML45_9RHOB|nr:TonB-dependent receptor plug domain-containing protein [Thioclava marina]OOY11956.1 hypothetical protein BMG00_12845 [Thioclava marina]